MQKFQLNLELIPSQPYGFTGRRYDAETGLWYFRNRMYSAGLERFVSRDPGGFTDGWNLYKAYFVPNHTDPYGLEVFDPNTTYGLGLLLALHVWVGNGITFTKGSGGLMADSNIKEESRSKLQSFAGKIKNELDGGGQKSDTGKTSISFKPQPSSNWLIQTTNVPSDSLTVDLTYTAKMSDDCKVFTFNSSNAWAWKDKADFHPKKHWFPDAILVGLKFLEVVKEYDIDIRWQTATTYQYTKGKGANLSGGWPFN